VISRLAVDRILLSSRNPPPAARENPRIIATVRGIEHYDWIRRIVGWRPAVSIEHFVEEVQVLGRDLVDRVKTLIHEGNVNRIIIKDDKGQTFVEIPVTVAAVGALAAPVLAAVGALSALVAKFKIVVERSEPKPAEPPETSQAQSKAP
jgi:hypothetical protein